MFFRKLGRFIFGKSMATSQLGEEKLNVFWGMPILSSDSISSVAYAVEEILLVLVPAIGVASFLWMPRIALAIIALLMILVFSYRHVVDAYPNGGGAYVVAKENLGPMYSLIAGASLSVDYVLTVSVSIAAATAAVASAFPYVYGHRVALSLIMVFLLAVGNLRGIRESSRLFSLPTYAFILSVVILIGAGVIKHLTGAAVTGIPPLPEAAVSFGAQGVTIMVLIRAFASGCSAVTGVEAVSNAVPNFKTPAAKNAKLVYLLLAAAIIVCFGGVAYLAQVYQITPNSRQTVISQLALSVFGQGLMFYVITAATTLILALAANTAYSGFPTLLSVIARDGYVPRQLSLRGHRLNFNNGIIMLSLAAAILLIVFRADTHLLINLYAVGVFTSFTLSQTGMVVHWWKEHARGWRFRAAINGMGALVTGIAVSVIGFTKFAEGAWIVLIVVPLLIFFMLRIKRHYMMVAQQLDIPNEYIADIKFAANYSHHVIVPIDSLNVMVVKALRYARSITPNVEAFHVELYEGEADKLRHKWELLNTDIPLVIKYSPYREVVNLLTEYIDSEEHASHPGDLISVLLPQFFVSHRWQMALHNNTSLFIANAMLKKRNIIVSIIPFYLDDIKFCHTAKEELKKPQSKAHPA
ncbi:MAG: APC family permease [Syntrophomonadaceae bacterium]|nr:APC family permease [Syntrophomonadaceae bacterium]